MENWTAVYSTNLLINAELLKHMLANHNITAVLKNVQDSMYHFGSIQLYVKPADIIRAKHLISKSEL